VEFQNVSKKAANPLKIAPMGVTASQRSGEL